MICPPPPLVRQPTIGRLGEGFARSRTWAWKLLATRIIYPIFGGRRRPASSTNRGYIYVISPINFLDPAKAYARLPGYSEKRYLKMYPHAETTSRSTRRPQPPGNRRMG